MTLWEPSDIDNLYVDGSASRVLDVIHPDLKAFPKFALSVPHTGVLHPGDVLFIPGASMIAVLYVLIIKALWFHNTWTLTPSISVNTFFKSLPDELYAKKDLYGNKDLAAYEKACEDMKKILADIRTLPLPYSEFYLQKLKAELNQS